MKDKKNFVPILRHYNNDLAKRWRVEYWQPTHNGKGHERVAVYGNINKFSTIEDRHQAAALLINSLSFAPAKEKNILEIVVENGGLQWRPKTTSAYFTVVEVYKKYCKKIAPENATTATINGFLLYLQQNKTSQNTIAKYRNTLFTLYTKAISQGLATINPVQKVPGIKRSPKSLMFFTDAQIELFKRAEMSGQMWLAIRLLFYCFVRPGEMRLLRIADINFENSFIEIGADISKNRKTQKVSIPDHFLQELLKLQQYPNNFYVLSKSGAPGAVPVSTKWINNEHCKLLAALKIRGRYAFYSWKHTGAVKAVKAGVNIKDLQLQLRHHSLDMVNEYLKNLGVLDSEDLRRKFPTL